MRPDPPRSDALAREVEEARTALVDSGTVFSLTSRKAERV
jgi:hypothetical protein